MGVFFHFDGNLLETIGVAERVAAQVLNRPDTSLNVRINQEMRNSGGFVYTWRKVLRHIGFSATAISKIMHDEVTRYEANWTRDLGVHMMAYKAG